MDIIDTWNDITPTQRMDIIKDLIEDTQGQGLSTQEAEGLLNLGRMQIEAEEADVGDQYLKQALFYLTRIREQNMDDPEPKALNIPVPAEKKKAAKPSKGRCSQCKNDRLRFNDDGSGDCPDCGRKFTWDKSKNKPLAPPIAQEPVIVQPPPPRAAPRPEPKGDGMDLPTDAELAGLDFSQFDGPSTDPQEGGPPEPIAPEPQPPDPMPPLPLPGPDDPEPSPQPEPDDDDDDGDDDDFDASGAKRHPSLDALGTVDTRGHRDDDDDFDASGATGQKKTESRPVSQPDLAPKPTDLLEPTPTEPPKPVELPEPIPALASAEASRPVQIPEPTPPPPPPEMRTPTSPEPKPVTDLDVNALFSDVMLTQKNECDVAVAIPLSQPQPALPPPTSEGPATAIPTPASEGPAPARPAPQDDPEKRILKMACEKAQQAYEKMEAKRKEGADVSLVENMLRKSRVAMAQKDYVAALNMSGEALRVIDGIVVPSDELLEPTPVPEQQGLAYPMAPEAQKVPKHQDHIFSGPQDQQVMQYQGPLQQSGIFQAPGAERASDGYQDPLFAMTPSAQADMGISSEPVFKEDEPSKVFSLDPKDDVTSIYEAPQQDRSVYDSLGHGAKQQDVYSGNRQQELGPYGGLEGSNTYNGSVEAQPAYAQQPLLTALCYNCNGSIPIYSDQRPLIISCPACGVQVQLD